MRWGAAHGARTWVFLLGIWALAGCAGDDEAALRARIDELERQVATTTTILPTASTSAATFAPAAAPTTLRVPRPEPVEAKQGDMVFAVFIATGASGRDQSFTSAKARLADLGYRMFSEGETTCSQGAKEAVPRLQDISLSVEFATRADADLFAALYGPVIGTVAVTVYCAD